MKPTKITIRCEPDSPRGINVRAHHRRGELYYEARIEPGNQADFDQHRDIYIVIEDD